jgi:membrane-bound metal-dependent hydrolase YbcI (DUF457 family)
MLIFAHMGITLIAGEVINHLAKQRHIRLKEPQQTPHKPQFEHPEGHKPTTILGMNIIDWTFCAIGSLLPDIIDKPVGQSLFGQTFGHNGRIFSHTLVFFILCLAAGYFFYLARKKVWVLYLAFGVLMHLMLDYMWQSPQTLFWPIEGWSFPENSQYNLRLWIGGMLQKLTSDPVEFVLELVGFLAMVVFMLDLVRSKFSLRSSHKQLPKRY